MARVEQTARNVRIGRWAGPALVVAALLYSSWLLSYALPVNVGTVDGYVSELPARDQPYRWIFAGSDIAAGALVLAVGIAGAVKDWRAPWWLRAAWWALAVFGLFTVLDAAFPLDCAPSVTQACHDAEQNWTVSGSHRIHAVTSVVSYVAIIAHMGLAAWGERRRPGLWPGLGRSAAPLAAVMLVSTLTVLALVPTAKWIGVPQRVSVACVALWLVLLGFGLGREEESG
jgi:hypothetical membrane protein